jgi:hypothetical protein
MTAAVFVAKRAKGYADAEGATEVLRQVGRGSKAAVCTSPALTHEAGDTARINHRNDLAILTIR